MIRNLFEGPYSRWFPVCWDIDRPAFPAATMLGIGKDILREQGLEELREECFFVYYRYY